MEADVENNLFERLKHYFYSFVRISMLITFSLIVYYTVADMAGPYLTYSRGDLFGNKQWVLRSYFLIFVYVCFLLIMSKAPFLSWNKIVERVVVCLFLLFCIFASYYFANDGLYEISVVNDAAQAIVSGKDLDTSYLDFLSRYNYIRAVTCYAAIWYKIGGKAIVSLAVCGGMTLGFWVCLQILKLCKGNNSSLWVCSGLFYISVPIFLSCSIFYNYTVVFWMPVTILYLYMLLQKEPERKKRLTYYGLIIVIASMGTSVFTVVAVPVIAVVIDMILNRKKEAVLLGIAVLFGTIMINKITYRVIDESLYNNNDLQVLIEKNEIPMFLSTMYTGLNYDSLGLYTNEDLAYVLSLDTYEEKVEGCTEQIKNRLSIGSDLPSFLFRKSSVNFGQGTYYTEAVSNNRLLTERSVIRFFSQDFPQVVYYRSFFCAMNIIFLCLMLWLIKKRYENFNLMYLTMFGVWMVSLICETDSRHIFPYLPLFIVMSAYAISILASNYLESERVMIWKK